MVSLFWLLGVIGVCLLAALLISQFKERKGPVTKEDVEKMMLDKYEPKKEEEEEVALSWKLRIPREKDKTQLVKWAREQMDKGVPRGVICHYLLSTDSSDLSSDEMDTLLVVENELFRVMVDRNCRGKELEQKNHVDEAINLYEQNVADWFSGNGPYDRLRIIYTKRKEYDEAIRVCKSFARVAENLITAGSLRADLKPKLVKFEGWINKLEQKKARQRE